MTYFPPPIIMEVDVLASRNTFQLQQYARANSISSLRRITQVKDEQVTPNETEFQDPRAPSTSSKGFKRCLDVLGPPKPTPNPPQTPAQHILGARRG